MRYLIFAVAALFAGECALAQTTAPADPAEKNLVTQPARAKGATAAKSVGTKGMTGKADSYQERKRAGMAKRQAAKGGEPKAAADAPLRPGSMMTGDERAAHRAKLQSFKTLAECETYERQHQAEMEARAKAQQKTLREATGTACNRYKVAAGQAAAK